MSKDQNKNIIFPMVFLLLFLFFQPIYKYMEYVMQFPRINITVLMLILLVLWISVIVYYGDKLYDNYVDTIFWLLLYITVIQLVSLPFAIQYTAHGLELYLKTVSRTIIASWLFWLTGIQLMNLINNSRMMAVLRGVWITFSILTILTALSTQYAFVIELRSNVIYLMMADAYAVLSILTLLKTKNNIIYSVMLFVSIIALFSLYSRASLYLYLFVNVIVAYERNKAVFIIIAILLAYYIISNFNEIRDDRMFRIILGGSDTSKNMRRDFLILGLRDLKSTWLFGQFLGEVDVTGKGTYIHNYLSFLRQYGIVPFLFMTSIIIKNYIQLVVSKVRGSNGRNDIIFYLATFILLELIFARTYTHAYIWLVLSSMMVLNKKSRQ